MSPVSTRVVRANVAKGEVVQPPDGAPTESIVVHIGNNEPEALAVMPIQRKQNWEDQEGAGNEDLKEESEEAEEEVDVEPTPGDYILGVDSIDRGDPLEEAGRRRPYQIAGRSEKGTRLATERLVRCCQ